MAQQQRRSMRDPAPLRQPGPVFLNLPPQAPKPRGGLEFPPPPPEGLEEDEELPPLPQLAEGQQRGRDELNRRAEAARRDAPDRDLKSVRRSKQDAANKAAVRRSTLQYTEDGRIGPGTVVPFGPFRGGMPPQYAGSGRAPVVGSVAVESGILPGEEQVTTADTLGQLSDAERKQLEAMYEQSGMAGTGGMETFEDWASTHFGDAPPQERLGQMRRAAGMQMPPETIVPQEEVLPGQNSRLAQGRVDAGGVLPEGRDIKQYGQTQRRQMGTNIWNPHAQMTVFGGTHVHNPNGSLSARAPRPGSLDRVGPPAGPDGQYSDEQVIRLGQAYNIDVGKYGNDTDLLRADVMREKERHDRLATKYNIIPNHMGGYRYTPNDAMKAQEQGRKTRQFANTLIQRYQGMPGFDPAVVEAYANDPDGYAKLVQYSQGMRGKFLGNAAQTGRNHLANETLARKMASPAGPGMAMRSMREAIDSGNLPMAATIAAAMGQPQLAAQLMEAHNTEVGAAVALKTGEGAKTGAVEKFNQQRQQALALPDGEGRIVGLMGILGQMNQLTGAPTDPKQLRAQAEQEIAEHEASRRNIKHPLVVKRLKELSNDKPAFMALLARAGITGPAAEQEWKQAGGWMRNVAAPAAGNAALGLAGLVAPLSVGIPLLGGLLGGQPAKPKPKPEKDPFE